MLKPVDGQAGVDDRFIFPLFECPIAVLNIHEIYQGPRVRT